MKINTKQKFGVLFKWSTFQIRIQNKTNLIFAAAAAAAGATAVRRTAGRLSAVRGARRSGGGRKN